MFTLVVGSNSPIQIQLEKVSVYPFCILFCTVFWRRKYLNFFNSRKGTKFGVKHILL